MENKAYPNDITSILISEEEIKENISRILPDTLVLDCRFNILNISNNLCEALGYSLKDLLNKPMFILFDEGSTEHSLNRINEKLKNGFFEEFKGKLVSKMGEKMTFGISGFYLGLISDISDLIILKARNINEVSYLRKRLKDKSSEMDQFIYQSSHRLRGPLATIKGLINVAQMDNNGMDIKMLLCQMQVFANLLDDRLFQLMYFAEVDKISENFTEKYNLATIGEKFSAFIKSAGVKPAISLKHNLNNEEIKIEKGDLVLRLLKDIYMFFSLQERQENAAIEINFKLNGSFSEIFISVKGLVPNEINAQKLKTMNFGFAEILKVPEYINLFSAKKIILKLNGNIYFSVQDSGDVQINIMLPAEKKASKRLDKKNKTFIEQKIINSCL